MARDGVLGNETAKAAQAAIVPPRPRGLFGWFARGTPTFSLVIAGLSSPQPAGATCTLSVSVCDALRHVIAGYTGTIHFASTDPGATLPADYTYLPADAGMCTFSMAFATPRKQTVTVTDTNPDGITPASITIAVSPAPAEVWPRSGQNQSGRAGQVLPIPLCVRVGDGKHHPLPGVAVEWAVMVGGPGATITPVTSISGAHGLAQATATLGAKGGANIYSAKVQGLIDSPVSFMTTATPITSSAMVPSSRFRLLLDGSDASKWISDGGGIISADAGFGSARPDPAVGPPAAAIRLTCPTYAVANTCSMSSPVASPAMDLSAVNFLVGLYVYPGSGAADPSGINYIRLLLHDVAGHSAFWQFERKAFRFGMNYLALSPADASVSPAGSTPDLSTVSSVELAVSLHSRFGKGHASSVALAGLWTVARLNRPFVCITFDDIFASQNAALAAAASRGIPVSIFGPTSWVGRSGRLSLADLRSAEAQGHLVCNHSVTHPYPWSTVDLTQRISEVTIAMSTLNGWGFTRGSRIFASPGGEVGLDDESVILGSCCDLFRSTINLSMVVNPAYPPASAIYVPTFRSRPIPVAFWDAAATNNASLVAAAASSLNAAQKYGGGAVELYHCFNSGNYLTEAQFEAHLDAIVAARNAGKIVVLRMDDLLGPLD